MIISRSKKFIFIHIPKTAGTSVRTALRPYTRTLWGRFIKNFIPENEFFHVNKLPAHTNAIQTQILVGKEFYDTAFSFAFVRNPWDREVSLYHYVLGTPDHYAHKTIHKLSNFESYLRWRANEALPNQWDYIADGRQGEIIIDHVARFEDIQAEFQTITKRIGIEVVLPKVNTSKRSRDYRGYYSDEAQEIVSELYKTDIEKFGYTF